MQTIIKTIVFIMPVLLASGASAQTTAEWFSQKSTQKQYLLQQIAALQVYNKYLRSGYGIAKGGLGSIIGSLRSEHGLHSDYYRRLKTPSAPVKNNDLVKAILSRQQDILSKVKEMNGISGLDADEKRCVASVGTNVLKDCDQQLQTLANIRQDGKMEMSDADRLAQLNKVYAEMIVNYRFISAYTAQVRLYVAGKSQEQQQITTTKRLYGIN